MTNQENLIDEAILSPTYSYIKSRLELLENHTKQLGKRIEEIDREYDIQIDYLKERVGKLEKQKQEPVTFAQAFKNFLNTKPKRTHAYPPTRAKPTKTQRQPRRMDDELGH